jgi:hypothetical protein
VHGDELVIGVVNSPAAAEQQLIVAWFDAEAELRARAMTSEGSARHASLHVGLMDANEVPDILLNGRLFHFDRAEDTLMETEMAEAFTVDARAAHQVLVSDIDGDERDDVILVMHSVQAPFVAYSHQELQHFDESTGEQLESEFKWYRSAETLPIESPATWNTNTVFIAADVDSDSSVWTQPLTEDGELILNTSVTQMFNDNTVLAVIAGPPCFEQFGQDLGSCSTGWGLSTSGSGAVGGSLTIGAKASVGVEAEAQAGGGLFAVGTVTVAKASAKLTLGLERSVYGSMTMTREETIAHFAAAGEDLVVFHTTPFNQYVYDVVSVDGTGTERPGDRVVVNIPLTPRTLAVSREYYNRNNGEQRDVDASLLPNVFGDLDSFPRASDLASMEGLSLGRESSAIYVNEGAGGNEVSVTLSSELTVGGEITLSSEIEAEACAVTVCAGGSVSSSVSVFVEASFGAGTTMTGSVAAMPAASYAENQFQYGIFGRLVETEHQSDCPSGLWATSTAKLAPVSAAFATVCPSPSNLLSVACTMPVLMSGP